MAPYLVIGLLVGALMDRWRRQRTLMITSLARMVVFGVLVILLVTGTLTLWSLAAISLALGTVTLFSDSASQPLLPRIVPRNDLVPANARLSQSHTVAETAGPSLGGILMNTVGAPIVFALQTVIAAVAAVLQSRIAVDESKPPARAPGRNVGHDIAEGMRYTYRHRTLRPLALSIHAWFLGNSIVVTTFGLFVLRELDLPEWAFGVAIGIGGIGGFCGAMLATRIGKWLGAGRAILLGRVLVVLPWAVLAIVPLTAESGVAVILAFVGSAQFVYCLAMGIEDANDISYRQAVAPDRIQGRMNASIRTVNRAVFFVGALLTGALLTFTGYRWTLAIAAAVFLLAAALVAFSPLRTARHGEDGDERG